MIGWFKIHRQLLNSPFWTCEPFTRGQAWVDLIGLTNHADNFFYCRGIKVDVKRGQCGWSEVALAQRWKWSRSKLRKFLNDLEKEQQIKQQKGNVNQIITIINYEIYQEKEQQTEQQKDSRKTTEEQQKDTNKNDNNIKNENNENNDVVTPKPKRFVKPTIEEIKDYCIERKNNVDAEHFFNKYEANGWKVGSVAMRDWRASVRYWEKSNFNNSQNGTPKPSKNGSYD